MIHNSRFFSNTDCYYFPCHQSENDKGFNCLFCYCPLYFFSDCGGHPVVRDRVKDCSNCNKPHQPGGYEHVIARLTRYFEEVQSAQSPSETDRFDSANDWSHRTP